ncbi:radical SAM protein (plasmid) [Ralstonia solanacearum]|uniref:Radical SAM protein n=2 Tax=Ralstonia solanacearum TaxID=305 RepID=A0AAD0SDI8_RALSL|nr:radical SAM protein [Ralstonia solanacearum]AXW55870.1 radical SAM protein [Ralstonia solanacearum]CBJ35321.1 conserved hypothethical protein, Radical SAM enzymes domain [Ralstonia solanacearum PSI07]
MEGDLLVMVKVAERCNINCSYCYMYQGVDQGWRSRPRFLSDDRLDLLAERLERHRQAYPAARMTLEIHGGEPLLLGKRRTGRFLDNLRRRLSSQDLFIVTQSNGMLLDTEWLDLFAAHEATLAISCDGPPAMHDRHRVGFTGAGTGAQVERALRLCLSHRTEPPVFNGVLAVVDPNNDPRAILQYFHALGVSDIDFLLPDAHYAAPPRHLLGYSHRKLLAFLCQGFDAWITLDDPTFRVRMFETFIRGVLGRRSELDAFGGALAPIVVVESDGSYRLLDVLAICEVDAGLTGLDLSSNTLHECVAHASGRYPDVCDTCRHCVAFGACGGGYVAHRFDGRSYDHPSFYCEALLGFYLHVRAYLVNAGVIPAHTSEHGAFTRESA